MIRRTAWLALAASLAGCATRPPAGADAISGRLSVHVEAAGEQPARSLTAAFELQGDTERGEMRLSSPLGSMLALARWSPDAASLTTAGGQSSYSDLDALARDALGEALPLRALPAWLRGRPWAGAASRPNPRGFEQLGWQVGLDRYAEGFVEATRAAPPAVTVRARLEAPG